MKKVMILGAGYTQAPLYEAARRIGVRTVAVSIPGDYPCFHLADEVSYTDITDADAVIREGRRLHADGVTSCGLDLMMSVIGPVTEALKVPGPPAEASLLASDKLRMKEAFAKGGVRTAAFVRAQSQKDVETAAETMRFPLMVKAVDQNGSRGIFRCDTPEEALRAFELARSVSRRDYIVVEEFIAGSLAGAEGMIQNGEFLFLMPNDTETFRGTTDIPVGHVFPLANSDYKADIEEQVRKAAAALRLDNCPFNCDLILGEDGVYVIEMTGRSGANGLMELAGIFCGVDYYEMIIRLSLGEDLRPYFANQGKAAAVSHILKSPVTGRLAGIGGADGLQTPDVSAEFNVSAGDEIRAYTNCADRIGQIIAAASNRADAERVVREMTDRLYLMVEVNEGAGVNRYPVL